MPLSSEYLQHVPFKIGFLLVFFAIVRCGSVLKSTFRATPHCHSNIYQFSVAKKQEIVFDIQQREADVFQISA